MNEFTLTLLAAV